MFPDRLVVGFLFMDSGIEMVEVGSVVVESAPIGSCEFVQQVLDQHEALVEVLLAPPQLD